MTSQLSALRPMGSLMTLAVAALFACDPGSSDDGTDPGTDGSSGGADASATDGSSDDGVDGSTGSDSLDDGSDGSDDSGSSGGGEGPEYQPYTGDYDLESFDVVSTDGVLGEVAITVGSDGDVHIAFSDRAVNGNFRLRYAHRPYGSDDFETMEVAPLVHEPVEVFVDTEGRPCIVSVRRENSTAAPSDLTLSCRNADDTWEDEVVVAFAGGLDSPLDLDLAVDLDGEPALFYLHPNTGEMTTARRSGGTWSMNTTAIADVALVSANAIAIDSNNEVHLAMFGFGTVDPNDPSGAYYVGPDGTVAFGAALGSNASGDLDLVLLQDDAPMITRADGVSYTLNTDDLVPVLDEFEHPENVLDFRVRYDPIDDVTFRTYNIGNIGFDVRQGGAVWTEFEDPGSGAALRPALGFGQLYLAHWEGGGVPPQLRLLVASPS